jgi:hypothetical protein
MNVIGLVCNKFEGEGAPSKSPPVGETFYDSF